MARNQKRSKRPPKNRKTSNSGAISGTPVESRFLGADKYSTEADEIFSDDGEIYKIIGENKKE